MITQFSIIKIQSLPQISKRNILRSLKINSKSWSSFWTLKSHNIYVLETEQKKKMGTIHTSQKLMIIIMAYNYMLWKNWNWEIHKSDRKKNSFFASSFIRLLNVYHSVELFRKSATMCIIFSDQYEYLGGNK